MTNRYSLWKYILIGLCLLLAGVYSLPNVFGESPAVQVSSSKAEFPVDAALVQRIAQALQAEGLSALTIENDGHSVRARFQDAQTQIKAKDVIEKALAKASVALAPAGSTTAYVVALNLISNSPQWLKDLHALPMYLGLDLRGGVHFVLQVDTQAALAKKMDSLAGELRMVLREKNIHYRRAPPLVPEGVQSTAQAGNMPSVTLLFEDAPAQAQALKLLQTQFADVDVQTQATQPHLYPPQPFQLVLRMKPEAAERIQDLAVKQNISTLHKRVNELGVAEPLIAQQGKARIVVQLPGVQDTAKAKDILGRTATLEVRLVDDSSESTLLGQRNFTPPGTQWFQEKNGQPLLVKQEVLLTGENLTDAQPGFDSQTQEPAVHLSLDAKGTRTFQEVTRDNVGKRMAILLFEKGQGEVVTAPVIRSEIGGGRVQISGHMSVMEASDVSLLLRSGSLAAPMDIIEERTIGPSLGAENIAKGFHSVAWGFAAIALFMCVYYTVFGLFSSLALAVNIVLLVAVLSVLQATLTLPGIAAMALALGMAIDANVLINERVREELRKGVAPQIAIHTGYDRAWATILDSNITTLIAGVALWALGSGPIRGFAVVHCMGILTSMFSAVFFSRGLVNLWYGYRKKLKSVAIGTVWKPE